MKIHIDGRYYDLPQDVEDRLLGQLYHFFAQIYVSDFVPKPLRLAMKPLARHELESREKAMNKAGLDGKVVRPVDGGDPALRVVELELGKLRGQGKLKDVVLHIQTEADTTISAFAVSIPNPHQAGGFDTTGGNQGERQDDRGATSGQGHREIIPYQ